MKFWALFSLGALLPFSFAGTLSSGGAWALLLLTAVAAAVPRLRLACLLPASFLLTTLAINERLAQRLPVTANRSVHELSGVVGNLPRAGGGGLRFLFVPDDAGPPVPRKINVYWHTGGASGPGGPPLPRAGERWRLSLELRVPRGRVNFHGSDAERWYFVEGIGALGYVRGDGQARLAAARWFDPQHWRASLLDKLAEKAAGVPAFRLLAALAVADRRALLRHDREVLAATGTGHLLAISGLHIGLAAGLGYGLGRLASLLIQAGGALRFGLCLPWCCAWLAALAYAALSGFGVSTQRALIMLSVASAARLSRRNVHPLAAWLTALALVLVADPFAPLQAGFWFSFLAVAVLLMLFLPRTGPMPAWRRMLLAQLGISLVMAPLGMYWFGQASLPGLVANLVAIPVVSLVVVPLLLLALPALWLPGPLAGWLLAAAGHSAQCLLWLLEFLSGLQPAAFSATRNPGVLATALAMLGAAVALLPRGVPGRLAGWLLWCPMLFPPSPPVGPGTAQVDFLDVGQGLAVLVAGNEHLLVYDTGPGNGLPGEAAWDTVDGTLRPMIAAVGRAPDLVVASHADIDHAGGLERMRAVYPAARYLASLPRRRDGIAACVAPAEWAAGGLRFRLLHPSPGLPYLGNQSSCVLSVRGPGFSLLLGGDMDRSVEQRLVRNGLGHHSLMVAPHHGSATSSSQALIEAVRPDRALVSAAADNRFGFPRTEVLGRYADAGVPTSSTASCGGIRLRSIAGGGFEMASARVRRNSIWRWPAPADCPRPAPGARGFAADP